MNDEKREELLKKIDPDCFECGNCGKQFNHSEHKLVRNGDNGKRLCEGCWVRKVNPFHTPPDYFKNLPPKDRNAPNDSITQRFPKEETGSNHMQYRSPTIRLRSLFKKNSRKQTQPRSKKTWRRNRLFAMFFTDH